MYRINLDYLKKIIYIELSGVMSKDEMAAYVKDFSNLLYSFEQNLFSVLVLTQRLDPISQDNIPVFQKAIEVNLSCAKMIAIVSGNRVITQMQMKRIENDARKAIITDTKIVRFKTKKDA